jgi:deoxyribodipyrimidine photo-lyase
MQVPPMPAKLANLKQLYSFDLTLWAGSVSPEQRSAVPYQDAVAQAGETAALRHLHRYFASDHVRRYKETRNGLIGFDYSTKFSPWLAVGAVSARQIYQQLAAHEAEFGANDSTYWIWFELLWRDYFRFLHLRFGHQLYHRQGLKSRQVNPDPSTTSARPHHVNHSASSAHLRQGSASAIPHSKVNFERWCQGNTGQQLIDAGMRELKASGYLSNRMRQIVASFLVNDLQCDWRAGAAWFESQLIDFDIYSNQGNWLYLAGFGTDPRSNRRFNLDKQAQTYDPERNYVQLWLDK